MPRIIIIPTFTLTQVCTESDPGAQAYRIPANSLTKPHIYHHRPIARPSLGTEPDTYTYNHLPIVLDGNNAPWLEANLYILDRLEAEVAPKMLTYRCLADDLALFKRYIEEEDIDFKNFPKRKLHRPTYRYRGNLEHQIHAQEIAPTTARRRMSAVIGFYRWMVQKGFITPKHPMWVETDRFISFKNNKGFSVSKLVKSTDIAVKVVKQNDDFDGSIDDGGKLRPLTPEEQEWLVIGLKELGNTRMTLMHYIALFTGARIQTVLTMRVRHVRLDGMPDDLDAVPIAVGPGAGIDTKGGQKMVIHIPRWLYEKLRIYADSDRARELRERAGEESEDQYLFLTDRGRPYYQSERDRTLTTRNPINGQSVREYIRKYIIPMVRKLYCKPQWRYKFHDLRATFGMNLTEHQMALVQAGDITLHQAREFVKARMGHASSVTTDLYLDYRGKLKMVRQAQAQYEEHLAILAQKAIEGSL